MATLSIAATWTKAKSHQSIQRSSHSVAAIASTIYVFGGELRPREPRDNDLHKVNIPKPGLAQESHVSISTIKVSESPSPRVGSAMTGMGKTLYLFSGRGGPSMSPINEDGNLWTFNTSNETWSRLTPSRSSPIPEARSFHAMTSNNEDKIYIHAGCPSSDRLNDFWEFGLLKKEWKQLASAPGPRRGGTSIAFAEGRIWRMGGFDGKVEVGGSIDVYSPESDRWDSISFEADGRIGPGARSVAALLPVEVEGRGTVIVSLFGESDPSSLGHQGAGKMLSDVWGYETSSGKWAKVEFDEGPEGRGWFDGDVLEIGGKDAIVVAGGLGESNERLDDMWVLQF